MELFSRTADLRHAAYVAATHGDQAGVFKVKEELSTIASREGLSSEDQERIRMIDEIIDVYTRIALNPGEVVDVDPDYWQPSNWYQE